MSWHGSSLSVFGNLCVHNHRTPAGRPTLMPNGALMMGLTLCSTHLNPPSANASTPFPPFRVLVALTGRSRRIDGRPSPCCPRVDAPLNASSSCSFSPLCYSAPCFVRHSLGLPTVPILGNLHLGTSKVGDSSKAPPQPHLSTCQKTQPQAFKFWGPNFFFCICS